jgi:hypothetical protein
MRAFLSDRYRPVDTAPLLNVILPIVKDAGLTVQEWELNDRKFYLRMTGMERNVQDIVRDVVARNPQVGTHYTGLHEQVSFGVSISNSEVGMGMFSVSPIVKVLRCINLLQVVEALKQRHVGGRAEADETMFQPDTRRLDDAAVFLKVRDKLLEVLAEETH